MGMNGRGVCKGVRFGKDVLCVWMQRVCMCGGCVRGLCVRFFAASVHIP